MPRKPALPDSLRPLGATEDGELVPSGHREPIPLPTRQAGTQRLRNRTKSIPSCLRQGVVFGPLRVSRHQIHGSPFFSRQCRLAVYNRNAWLCFSARRDSNLPPKPVVEPIERSVDPPPAVASPYRGGIGKVNWQISPLASSANQVKNRVDHFSPVNRLRVPGRLRSKKRRDARPLLVGQI